MENGEAPNGVSDRILVKLKTNDFPIDLAGATIYKYRINFSPNNIPTKEKKILSEKFLARLKLNHKDRLIVQNEHFEFFLAKEEAELEKFFFQVVSVPEKVISGGAVSTHLHGKNFYTTFQTDHKLITSPCGTKSACAGDHTKGCSLQLCTIFVTKEDVNLDSIRETRMSSQTDMTSVTQQKVVLDALNDVLQQEARNASSLQIYGDRVFDMAGEPAMQGPFIEMRKGVKSKTCIVNGSAVRRVTPCLGFFLKALKLSELMQFLSSTQAGTGPALDMGKIAHMLKGLQVRKMYGKKTVVQVLGFAAGNADQETFYWNNHKTTTVSHYMEKVYHMGNVTENSQQKCAVVGSLKSSEVIPSNLCFVLSGQLFPIAAHSTYFPADAQQALQKYLHDVPSTCISQTDGSLTKSLKCSFSPTVAANFGVDSSGTGEQCPFGPYNFRDQQRMIEAEILNREIPVRTERLKPTQLFLVLVLAANDNQSLVKQLETKFGKSAHFVVEKSFTYDSQGGYDNAIRQLITDAQPDLLRKKSDDDDAKPNIAGIFCKPCAPKNSEPDPQQQIELGKLISMYKAIKLYSHQEGIHFAGTFLPRSFKSQQRKQVEKVVLNLLSRLETQRSSVSAPISGLVQEGASRSTLQLGLHVSQLDTPFLSTDGEQTSSSGEGDDDGCKFRWYAVSVVAKWSECSGSHKARTFLQRGCKSPHKVPATYPGALAMVVIEEIISELTEGTPLLGCNIMVFRAGIRAGKLRPEEKAELEKLNGAKKASQTIAKSHSSDIDVQNKADGYEKRFNSTTNLEDLNCEGTTAHKNKAQNSTLTSSSNRCPGADELDVEALNSEIHFFECFARARGASLAYVEVGGNTSPRLFEQDGQPVFQRTSPLLERTSNSPATVRTVSSILATPSVTKPNEFTKDWVVQKMLAKKAGPQKPLSLRVQSINKSMVENQYLCKAVSEALWDFPQGTWSSKNLSCVTLAQKANRHAMRVVRIRNGEPYLPEINPGLKDGLFFI